MSLRNCALGNALVSASAGRSPVRMWLIVRTPSSTLLACKVISYGHMFVSFVLNRVVVHGNGAAAIIEKIDWLDGTRQSEEGEDLSIPYSRRTSRAAFADATYSE